MIKRGTNMSTKIPVLAVVGPTASGKTGLSVALAKALHGEVLSFDSMQLYQGMSVATAKPTPEEMQGVPHHMVDCISPEQPFSVARYKEEADRILHDIHARGKYAVMVGGTGLYLDSVLQNIELLDSADNSAVREKLRRELEEQGPEAMHARLLEIDPVTANKLHPADTGRVLRALEVYHLTGYTMSYQILKSRENPSPYEPFYIGLTTRDRDVLYDRINRRVDLMLEQGLLEEAREAYENRLGATAVQAIGIKEMYPYFKGEATLEECTETLKKMTRRYAKRQLTWFRKNEAIRWLYLEDYETEDDLLKAALSLVKESGLFPEKSETPEKS